MLDGTPNAWALALGRIDGSKLRFGIVPVLKPILDTALNAEDILHSVQNARMCSSSTAKTTSDAGALSSRPDADCDRIEESPMSRVDSAVLDEWDVDTPVASESGSHVRGPAPAAGFGFRSAL